MEALPGRPRGYPGGHPQALGHRALQVPAEVVASILGRTTSLQIRGLPSRRDEVVPGHRLDLGFRLGAEVCALAEVAGRQAGPCSGSEQM